MQNPVISPTPYPTNVQALRLRDHEDAARVAIRGQIHARGGLREINGYLLGRDGPHLTPGQKSWLAQLRERPLRLYRVTDVQSGDGLTLVDELDVQAEPQSVRERSGSRSAKLGMVMRARIMRVGSGAEPADGHLELSGAIYPFAKLRGTQLLAQIRQVLAGAPAMKPHDENMRDLIETEIARAWPFVAVVVDGLEPGLRRHLPNALGCRRRVQQVAGE